MEVPTLVQCWFTACWPGPLHLHHEWCEHRDTGLDLGIFIPDNLLLSGKLPATGTVLMCRELVQLLPLLWLFSNSGKLRFWLTMYHGKRQHRRLRIRGRKQLWTAKSVSRNWFIGSEWKSYNYMWGRKGKQDYTCGYDLSVSSFSGRQQSYGLKRCLCFSIT